MREDESEPMWVTFAPLTYSADSVIVSDSIAVASGAAAVTAYVCAEETNGVAVYAVERTVYND